MVLDLDPPSRSTEGNVSPVSLGAVCRVGAAASNPKASAPRSAFAATLTALAIAYRSQFLRQARNAWQTGNNPLCGLWPSHRLASDLRELRSDHTIRTARRRPLYGSPTKRPERRPADVEAFFVTNQQASQNGT